MQQKIQTILLIFLVQITFAQTVFLNKVEKVNDNNDKFLYLLTKNIASAQYLGEIEVRGFSRDDAAVFSSVYKKAKETGANSYTLKPFETIDGKSAKFDAAHYRLNLYYTNKEFFDKNEGAMYIFASSDKDQKISINQKDYILPPRSYLEIPLEAGEIYTISTKKFLGSGIKFQTKNKNTSYYFQVSASAIKADKSGKGGLNLKSGDIIGLEISYGDFLRTVYQKIE